jgi:inosine-uridine nucleoside N-ribohydrolase
VVQKLVIDADPGIGDALAIMLALQDRSVDLVGVTATAGRVAGATATRNIQAVIDGLDPPKRPRIGHCGGAVSPLASPLMDGTSGLGDYNPSVAGLHQRHESARLLVELVRASPHEITLLTLGPLTNVSVAAELAADFFDLLGSLVSLGGAIQSGGDVTAAAEFNVAAGCESARDVLRSPATKTLVPLDASGLAVLSPDQYRRLRQKVVEPVAGLLDGLLPFSFRSHHEVLGIEGVVLHGVTALAAATSSVSFEQIPMTIDVELHGELTRGMTVFDRRRGTHMQQNIDACVAVDVQGVVDYLSSVLAG